jgi:hypothetical protein
MTQTIRLTDEYKVFEISIEDDGRYKIEIKWRDYVATKMFIDCGQAHFLKLFLEEHLK